MRSMIIQFLLLGNILCAFMCHASQEVLLPDATKEDSGSFRLVVRNASKFACHVSVRAARSEFIIESDGEAYAPMDSLQALSFRLRSEESEFAQVLPDRRYLLVHINRTLQGAFLVQPYKEHPTKVIELTVKNGESEGKFSLEYIGCGPKEEQGSCCLQ